MENGLSIKYAQNIGVEKENLMISYPSSAMKTFLIIRDLIRKNVDLIVVDSVSNLSPQVEDLEKYKTHKQEVVNLINDLKGLSESEKKARITKFRFADKPDETDPVRAGRACAGEAA